MHLLSLRRAALLAVALVVSTLSFVAASTAPASAADYTSVAEVSASRTTVRFGGSVTVKGRVGYVDTDGTYYAYTGTATLERLVYGTTTWSAVSSQPITDTTTFVNWTQKPGKPTSYRVRYSGGTDGADNFLPAVSTALKINVARNLGDNFRRSDRLYYGKVTPSYGRRTVIIQKSTCSAPTSSSCRWGYYKSVVTKSTGNWSLKLPVYSRRTHFRGLVKASNGYVTSLSNYYVTTYRY